MTIWHGQRVPNRHDAEIPCFMALSHYRDQKALYFSSETHCSILQHPPRGGGGVEGTTGHLAAGRGHASLRRNKKTLFASPLSESRGRFAFRIPECERAALDAPRPARPADEMNARGVAR